MRKRVTGSVRRLVPVLLTGALIPTGGAALAMSDLLGIDDIGYGPSFVLTSVQASFLGQGKIGFNLAGHDAAGSSALTLRASCVWDAKTGRAIETVDFGTGKILSTSHCPTDPWIEDVPCTLILANGSDPDMEKLRQRIKFGWPVSARVLYGERSKVEAALENAVPAPPVRTPIPNRGGGTSRSYLPTPTPTPKPVHFVPPGSLFPDYAATYALPLVGAPMKAGSSQFWDVGVKNESNRTWPANGPYKLSYQWYQNRMHVSVEERRSPMPKDVRTFESASVHASFVVPAKPGTYQLRWDMIEDGGAWFSTHGVAPGERTVVVVP